MIKGVAAMGRYSPSKPKNIHLAKEFSVINKTIEDNKAGRELKNIKGISENLQERLEKH